MLICYDPDEYEAVSEYHICPFHKVQPGEFFAGCTCSFSTMQRLRSPEDYAAIKAKKKREHEDRILAQAEVIKASRAIEQRTPE